MVLDGVFQLLSFKPTDSIPEAMADKTAEIQAMVAVLDGNAHKSNLPRDYAMPTVVIHTYGATRDQDFTGPLDIREDQIQMDAYGRTPDEAQAVANAIDALFVGYTGVLPDGTVVLNAYLERAMDMPFLPNAGRAGVGNRRMLGIRFVTQA